MPAEPVDFSCRPAEWIMRTATQHEEIPLLPVSGEFLTKARILSSLGVRVSLDLSTGLIDWEALSDLLSYAVYGRCPHAPIELFETMIAQPPPEQETLNEQFVTRDSCVNCQGWRACFGEWKAQCTPACQDFFTEIIDARLYRLKQFGEGKPCPH